MTGTFGKRGVLTVIVVLAVFVFLAGTCLAYDEKNPMVLKCGIDNPPQDMKARTIKKLGDLVTERTNGRIQFKYFYGASLIKKPQFVDAVSRGIADISTGPVGFVTGKIPELSVFGVFGTWQLDRYLEMQDVLAPKLTELMATKGIHHVMIQYNGTSIFCHKTKFLKQPADWKGQKIRLSGKWLAKLGQQWGSSTVFMPPPEVYLATQRGVIDGFQLIYDIVYGLKLHEVAPYIVETGFPDNIEIVTMNLKKWEAMTPEDQKIFNDAVAEVIPWTYEETLKYYETLRENITKQGGQIYKLTKEERDNYLRDAFAMWPEIRKESGKMGGELMDLMESYRIKID
jgi:TRAP-type C4-dicarboxylate transport system substrate-binding protein